MKNEGKEIDKMNEWSNWLTYCGIGFEALVEASEAAGIKGMGPPGAAITSGLSLQG